MHESVAKRINLESQPLVSAKKALADRSTLTKGMRLSSYLLPGDWLKTFFFLNCISAPRKLLRKFAGSFYRMEQLYDVLRDFNAKYKGPFSILEFGTANGYSFAKMLYATRYLGLENEVTVHAFDSFEGLRAPDGKAEISLGGFEWAQGQFKGNYEILHDYCEKKCYANYKIHKGYFEDSLTPDVIAEIAQQKPILVWVDCDYYSSSKTVFERLLPVLPSGCVFYFDDFEFNFGSRFTGEAKLVHEINHGKFGDEIELVPDRQLSLDSDCTYRFIRFSESGPAYEKKPHRKWEGWPRPIANGSPLP